ncbi:uncharacterized protein PGTG_00025 [Puccinia graminis f. sp. tritici CRL 75-36-700-3]|uniref:Uncharacterized protein n=1 Tax=Puccinia graminis f. sp. tritici (strain CRL 75-36-700-3 / race SCCL) TaxID=418459 RepID=E3JPY6_PUCGT|nr:uncharacterized protein PGTG_00025 [Puccinia graminis f. sp. tritici CRL 75-36-700-3]EFP74069.1 hypothetical protein PGTG_00025 [Puccinia graminis f. sp. tritici CRL 75-36-700-3]
MSRVEERLFGWSCWVVTLGKGRPGYLKHQHPGGGSTRLSGVLQGTPSGLIAGALEPAPTTHLVRRQPFTSSTSYIIGKMGTNKTQSAGSDRSTSILIHFMIHFLTKSYGKI